jgi:membrane-associated phospholipid phosphatase
MTLEVSTPPALAARLAACLALLTTAAHADGPLDDRHADGYYWARGGAVAGAIGATIVTRALLDPARPEPPRSEWIGWDDAVRGRLSTAASETTDVTLATAIAVPVGAQLAEGVDVRFVNTSLIHAEVLVVNLLLNTAVKYSVPRLRPYNYRVPPATTYVASQGVDAHLSFYSGHASTAFAAAVGGSYLFAAAHPDSAANPWLWGVETALAAATAVGRIRAGKHFYSDVAVGIVVGSVLGVGIPLLEGVNRRPTSTEIAFGGGGMLVGGLAAAIAPFQEDAEPEGKTMPFGLKIVPAFSRFSAGVSAIGNF